ncbi:hypothetical protein Syun_015927 [Stephania yunnanensis]|uniref:Uncharacterized protein n=1 Tax=Stephania yunnanensis TaxID=152371 RepID=A0AAP0J4Z0_9MAGN
MTLPSLKSILRHVTVRHPLIFYSLSWTLLLTITVAIASFSPEVAFVSAISPSSSFSRACDAKNGFVRVPVDVPGEVVCMPAQMFKNSNIDLLVPPIFAAAVVAGSALVVRAISLCYDRDDEYYIEY